MIMTKKEILKRKKNKKEIIEELYPNDKRKSIMKIISENENNQQ